MQIILVNGKKRSGKDYFASILKDELEKVGKTAEIMSFADPIKDILATTLNISLEELDEYKNQTYPIGVQVATYDDYDCQYLTNFRAILQNFGTEAMKKYFGENVWSELLLERASQRGTDFVIVPDFRFLSECVSDITVRIRNDEIDNNCTDNHRSENELNDFEFKYTINNSGRPDLTLETRNFIAKLLSS